MPTISQFFWIVIQMFWREHEEIGGNKTWLVLISF